MEDREFIFKKLDNKLQIKDNEVINLDIDKISDYLKGMFSVDALKYLHSWCESRLGECYGIHYSDGYKYWYKNGVLHRDGDKPATIYSNGSKEWYRNGELHRDGDKPATIYSNGSKYWYRNGELHRDGDKPAYISDNGYKEWWNNGKFIKEE